MSRARVSLLALCASVTMACTSSGTNVQGQDDAPGGGGGGGADAPHVDAPATTITDAPVDARLIDAMTAMIDAPASTTANTISCYRQNNPTATCSLPAQSCCFDNFSAQHNGACSGNPCAWGTIHCDGPEDCSGGQHCCAHAIIDPNDGLMGYTLGCQASACGAAPANQELCHPGGTCANGGTCVSTYLVDNDLPRSLYICQ